MNTVTLRLVLLVSSAHALVHIFELAYPSVEQLIATTFHTSKLQMGWLGSCWRIPFGACALGAGWLTDRYGARRTLVAYLFGCSAMAVGTAFVDQFAWLFVVFFAMGMFASVYHPAGLALISHAVPRALHPRALGIHGIFGSIGIAAAPFLAAVVLWSGVGWRGYYVFLAIPGVLLAGLFLMRLDDGRRDAAATDAGRIAEQPFLAFEYYVALVIAFLSGFIYTAVISFLPRYLDVDRQPALGIPAESMRNYLTAGVLLLGVIGQYTTGRFARSHNLPQWLAAIFAVVTPCLLAMALATGFWKIVAASAFAITYFMSQPVYNSLIPKFVPARRRSLGYGLNFLVTFGLGGLGSSFSGWAPSQWWNYATLAACSAGAGCLALVLWRRRPPLDVDQASLGN